MKWIYCEVKVLWSMTCVTGMGTQWAGMGCSLMQIPDFRESILRSDEALKDTGLVVSRMLIEADDSTFEDTVNSFVGLAAIQVCIEFKNTQPQEGHLHQLHCILIRSLFNLNMICLPRT